MKRIVSLLAAMAGLGAAPAMAQSDCHVGLLAGYVFGRSQHVPEGAAPFTDTFDVEGRGLGAQLGCLKARERWRYGFAVDLVDTAAGGDAQMLAPNQNFFGETTFEWIGTLRLVSGYEFDNGWLAYLTGGLAVTSIRMRVCQASTGICVPESQKFWGVVGGAGLQYRLLRRVSANVEYLVYGFEDKPFPRSGSLVVGDRDIVVNPEAQMLRFGLNFHF